VELATPSAEGVLGQGSNLLAEGSQSLDSSSLEPLSRPAAFDVLPQPQADRRLSDCYRSSAQTKEDPRTSLRRLHRAAGSRRGA